MLFLLMSVLVLRKCYFILSTPIRQVVTAHAIMKLNASFTGTPCLLVGTKYRSGHDRLY
ncbi:hypothetical protein M758_10G131100 [Ceratodon purpureus]|nr:hypothetical protein M758_10G131100 [Ceratodon purpureus]